MKKHTQTATLLAFLTVWAGWGAGHASERFLWRSWGAREGLTEAYSYAISVTPGGNAYIRHGAVSAMSMFDGYGVSHIPEPRGISQPYWPATRRVYALPGGSLWTATLDALREYRGGKWTVRYLPPASRHVLAAVPVGRRVMVLMEDAVREFDPEPVVKPSLIAELDADAECFRHLLKEVGKPRVIDRCRWWELD